MHLNYRKKTEKLEYINNEPKRDYVNLDPPEDRDTYKKLQIHNKYLGYKDIVYTPIDIPYIDVDIKHIESLWSDPKMEEGTTAGTIAVGKVLFLKKNKYLTPYGDGEWFDWVYKEIPHIKEFIKKLPFISIRQCAFVQPPKPVPPHYDEPKIMLDILKKQSPSQYRIRWSKITNNENEYFYLTKNSGETKIYPYLPKDTNTFVYDGSVYEHGSDKGGIMSERLQIVMSGILDVEKHQSLLDRSIKKYKDYYLTSEYFN
jgi:hypothetical protein